MNRPIVATSTEVPASPTSTPEDRSASASGSGDRGPLPDPRERLAAGGPIGADEVVELLCTDQVDRWRAGERIPAEAYLALHPTLRGGSEAAFELIYGEYLIRESLGDAPKVEEFCWRFPEFADRLRRQLSLHSALGETPERTEIGPGGEPGAASAAADGLAIPTVPGFEVMGILGQGAMSVVYLARQAALNRPVALKVIRARVHADPDIAARFRDEAEAAARFHHPNIVQVYEVGESEGQGYLVLEYAEGGSLQQKLAGNPQPPREAARLIEPIARALHYAHRRGIVHRDIKPANIVLSDEGIPKVTDFGLAKLMERESGLTRTGDIMGTPSYMAPEQARGTPSDVTGAADIYALGAILYESLTGRPPFKGATPLSTLSQAAEQEVLPPGRLQRHLPREIETICLKCLEKEPRKRYETAEHLADDLRRFLDDRPIVARRIGRAERLWRWCRREPVKATLAGALVLTVIAGFLGVMGQKRRAEDRARAEARERSRAEVAESKALDNLYFSRLAQARLEWRLSNAPVARQILERCDPARRGWEWGYLEGISHPELLSIDLPGTLSFVNAVAFSPDGRNFAFTAYNPYGASKEELRRPVEIWETTPARRLRKLEAPGVIAGLSFSPDGRRLAASGPHGARLWEVATGAEVRSWPAIGVLSYSPDGKALVSCQNHRVAFWDAESGRDIRGFASDSGRVTFAPDGRAVAVSGSAAVELRDAATGRELRRLPHGPGDPSSRQTRFFGEDGPELAFSPDGRSLAVATDPPRVWDTATGELRHQLGGHDGTVQGIAFSPDGRQIATAGVDSTIRLWDAWTGSERSVLRGHSAWVGCVAFHPEGWCLLSGGRQQAEVKLWDLTRDPEHISLGGPLPTAVHLEPDGRALRMIGPDGRLYRRDAEGTSTQVGPTVDMSQQWLTPAVLAEFSGDGRRIVTVGDDRRLIKLWDADDGRALATLSGLSVTATYVATNRDGGRVAAAAFTNRSIRPRAREVMVWDSTTGRVVATFRPTPAPTPFTHGRVALDGAGARVAFDEYEDADYDEVARAPLGHPLPFIRVCEVAGGREVLRLPMPDAGAVYTIAFSPDGGRIAAGEFTGRVWIWDAQTGAVLHETHWDERPFRLAFSPDGRRLAGVDRSKVQIRDVEDGRQILILRGARARPSDGGFNPVVAWSLDGSRLAASNWTGSTTVWDAPPTVVDAGRRLAAAGGRIFGWHLNEADAAIAAEQAGAAAFHLDRIVPSDPPDTTSMLRRAEIALRLRRLDVADRDFARWFAGGAAEDRVAALAYARLFLIRGDAQGYRDYFARLLESHEKGRDPGSAWELGRIAGLVPCSVADAERVVRVVKLRADQASAPPSTKFALALAHYRAGQWAPARAALDAFFKDGRDDAWLGFPLMSMIEHRLGRHREAEQQLVRAQQERDEHRVHSTSAGDFLDAGWFEYGLHLREAESTIGTNGGSS